MIRINAKKLLRHSSESIFAKLKGDFVLVFPDGELVTNERETAYSSFIWDMLRAYADTPLKMSYHLRHLLGKGEPDANMHIRLINRVFWDIFDTYRWKYDNQKELLEQLQRLTYETTNRIYNFFSISIEEYVASIDITHYVQITKSPVVMKALEDAPATQEGVANVNDAVMDEVLLRDPLFRRNPLAIAVRVGIAKKKQAVQCLAFRGYLTDIDSNIFKKNPILAGHISGIRKLSDAIVESRSASKSLNNTDAPLKQAEYFSRRQQLVCQNVRNLHFCDCGSTNHINWLVRDKRYEGDDKIYDSDLETLDGKYYLNEETGKYVALRRTDRHLIGKVIKMRDIVAGCNHPDPYGVCLTCFGELGFSIPDNSNFGHNTCVNMTSVVGQIIISTKHYEGSSKIEPIVLKPHEKPYFKIASDANSYYLNDTLKKNKRVVVRISRGELPGLPDLQLVDSVKSLNLSRTSQFKTIGIFINNGKHEDYRALDVYVNKRYSSLSYEFLEYIRTNGFTVTDDDICEFDMGNWNYDNPVFILPFSHFNMSDHQKAIEKLLERPIDPKIKKNDYTTPAERLVELHDLVNRRLSVNLGVLSLLLYASMVVNLEEGDYDLPKAWTGREIGAMRAILMSRSLSAQMAFEDHRQTFLEPASYLLTNRMDHLLDNILMPELYNQP